MAKSDKETLLKAKENCRRYRQEHLNKDKKFLSVRFSKEEGNEIKEFIKENNIPIKKIIEEGTEILKRKWL